MIEKGAQSVFFKKIFHEKFHTYFRETYVILLPIVEYIFVLRHETKKKFFGSVNQFRVTYGLMRWHFREWTVPRVGKVTSSVWFIVVSCEIPESSLVYYGTYPNLLKPKNFVWWWKIRSKLSRWNFELNELSFIRIFALVFPHGLSRGFSEKNCRIRVLSYMRLHL